MTESAPKVLSSIERIESLEHNLDLIKKQLVSTDGMAQHAVQTSMAIEQTIMSLAKTVSAVVTELQENKIIDSSAVMRRIRKSDEASDRERVNAMVEQKVIKVTDVVTAASLVVVKQGALEISPQGSRSVDITDYRTIEMPSNMVNDDTRKILLDKKVGETVEVKRDVSEGITTVLTVTILEVYELAEGDRGGE